MGCLFALFAGVFQAFDGPMALFNDTFYVAARNYLFQFDAIWRRIHLILGLIVAFAGWGLLSGRTWALAAHGRELREPA